MACPLSAILNRVDGSAQANPLPATGADDDDATISEASTEIIEGGMSDEEMPDEEMLRFYTLTKHSTEPTRH